MHANSMYTQNFSLGRQLTFASFVALQEIFSVKFGGVACLVRQRRAIRASFLRKNRIFINSPSFLPPKFPLYGIASSSWSSGWLDQQKRLTLSAALVWPSQMWVTGYSTQVSRWTLQNPGVTWQKRLSWKVGGNIGGFKLLTSTGSDRVPLIRLQDEIMGMHDFLKAWQTKVTQR